MNKFIPIILLAGLAVLFSCNIEPDEEDPPRVTLADIERTIDVAYDHLRTYLNGYLQANELTSDEMIPLRPEDKSPVWESLYRHEWTPQDILFLAMWEDAYKGIADINTAFTAMDLVTDPVPEQLIAEARALRAYYYFLLMDAFGNVPIVTEANNFEIFPDQNTRREVYDFIESELQAAISSLGSAPEYGRFNKDAARALLARLYLNADVYTGTPQWEKCRSVCDEIINSFRYQLTADYFDNFAVENDQVAVQEIILPAVFPGINDLETMDLYRQSLHPAQFPFQSAGEAVPYWAVPTPFFETFDRENDHRARALLAGQQYTGFDPIGGDSLFDGSGNPLFYTLQIDAFSSGLGLAGARVLKYEPDSLAGDNDFALFRYAEVLLTKAEAVNELGETNTAAGAINEVRRRVYEPDQPLNPGSFNQASLREQILIERGHELFWEGIRRQDLIRHGKFCGSRLLKPADDDCEKRKLFPIPQVTIDGNSKIQQNPGY